MNDTRSFLVHGLIAGLLAGIAAFLVAYAVGEPAIDSAIAIEEAASAEHSSTEVSSTEHSHDDGEAAGHSHDEESTGISRTQQAGPGLATATISVAVVIGGIIGIASAAAAGRIGRLGIGATTAIVAGCGFVAVALVPWLAYPPNPPAVGSAETIGERTAIYFSFVAISIVAMVGAIAFARVLLSTHGGWTATVAPALCYLAVVLLARTALGAIDEVPDTFAANTLFSFRIGSIATQAALWGVLGVTLTGLLLRTAKRAPQHA